MLKPQRHHRPAEELTPSSSPYINGRATTLCRGLQVSVGRLLYSWFCGKKAVTAMKTQVIFAQCALTLLSILASQKVDAAVSCATAGGMCIDVDSIEMEGCVSVEGKCRKNQECCLDLTRGGNNDRQCNRAGGKCKRKSDCNRNDILDEPCSGNEVCCDDSSDCNTDRECSREGGRCKRSCSNDEKKIRDGCKGSNCVCCVSECEPKSSCSREGGHCVSNKKRCDGRILNNGCSGNGCYCCISDSTGSTSSSSTPSSTSSSTPSSTSSSTPSSTSSSTPSSTSSSTPSSTSSSTTTGRKH
ncbi:uncharacterized protein DDB_G0271670-like [Penaeus monodon]|uniref:uncharacterized protein DDB_G0271670-like n=1 Tax=Penaeus monodon TaxID=6687 RepID=UPI0018A75A71|nr:uncharacterized protein DDB_G0271670-like [Penaeus monodon]